MAHIFFEKLENRRSTQSLILYPAPYPIDSYNWNPYNPAPAYPASSASWLNFSMPSAQSSSWNPMGYPSQQLNQGWYQPQSFNQLWNQPQQWNSWSPSQSFNQLLNQPWQLNQGWYQPQPLNQGWFGPFPSQMNQPSWGYYGPQSDTYVALYTYGVGFPIEISSSGILF